MMPIARLRPSLAPALVALLLSGCSSTDPLSGLTPSVDVGAGERLSPMNAPSMASVAPATSEPATASVAQVSSIGPIQFLPVVGAPAATVEALAAELATEAARAGVAISPAGEPATPLRLKGYLSALGEGRETVVIYVWDVVDPAGNRVSRIQGQERVPGAASSADPWTDVPRETLAAIARRTIGELVKAGTAG